MYALVNEGNIKTLTKELLDYLKVSDLEFKPDLTSKICMLVQRFLNCVKRRHFETSAGSGLGINGTLGSSSLRLLPSRMKSAYRAAS